MFVFVLLHHPARKRVTQKEGQEVTQIVLLFFVTRPGREWPKNRTEFRRSLAPTTRVKHIANKQNRNSTQKGPQIVKIFPLSASQEKSDSTRGPRSGTVGMCFSVSSSQKESDPTRGPQSGTSLYLRFCVNRPGREWPKRRAKKWHSPVPATRVKHVAHKHNGNLKQKELIDVAFITS